MENKFDIGDRVVCKEVVGKKRIMWAQGIIIGKTDKLYVVQFDQEIDGHGETLREWGCDEDDLLELTEQIQTYE